MIKCYKVRLLPTKEQEELMFTSVGCSRFAYNWALNRHRKYREQDYTNIEDMYFLENPKSILKCCNCGLEDYLHNLVPSVTVVAKKIKE